MTGSHQVTLFVDMEGFYGTNYSVAADIGKRTGFEFSNASPAQYLLIISRS